MSIIAHIDMDSFYAQVEHRRLQIPRDIPLAVQQWDGIIALNYIAKRKGVKRGHRVSQALMLCPNIRFVHVGVVGGDNTVHTDSQNGCLSSKEENIPDRSRHKVSLDRYRKASDEVMNVFTKMYSEEFERASVDEAFIDLTNRVVTMFQSAGSLLQHLIQKHLIESPHISYVNDTIHWLLYSDDTHIGTNDCLCHTQLLTKKLHDIESWDIFLKQCPCLCQLSDNEHASNNYLHWVNQWIRWLDGFYVYHADRCLIDAIYDNVPKSNLLFLQTLSTAFFSENGSLYSLSSKHPHHDSIIKRVGQNNTLSLMLSFSEDVPLLIGAFLVFEIRQELLKETEFTASAGIARNKFLAKELSSYNKPNAQTLALDQDVCDILKGIKIKNARGLRGKTGDFVLNVLPTVESLYDIQQYSLNELKELFLKHGTDTKFAMWLYNISRGTVEEKVKSISRVKSMLACKTFPPIPNFQQLEYWINILCVELADRLLVEYTDQRRVPKILVIHHTGGEPIKSRSRSAPTPQVTNKDYPTLNSKELETFVRMTLSTKFTTTELYPCTRLGIGATELYTLTDHPNRQQLLNLCTKKRQFFNNKPSELNNQIVDSQQSQKKPCVLVDLKTPSQVYLQNPLYNSKDVSVDHLFSEINSVCHPINDHALLEISNKKKDALMPPVQKRRRRRRFPIFVNCRSPSVQIINNHYV